MNNDRNFKNGGNEKNVGNVEIIRSIRTDIKYNNFLEPQARADLNDDRNFWIGGKVWTDIKCHIFLEPQAWAKLNYYGNFRNGGNVGMLRMSGQTDRYLVLNLFGTTSSSWF